MSNITYIKDDIKNIQNQILAGDNSDETLLKYFALLSLYYSQGGSIKPQYYIKDIAYRNYNKEHIIGLAKIHIIGGIAKITLHKSFKKLNADIFGIDTDKILKSIIVLNNKTKLFNTRIIYNNRNNSLYVYGNNSNMKFKLQGWSTTCDLENLLSNSVVITNNRCKNMLDNRYYNIIEQLSA